MVIETCWVLGSLALLWMGLTSAAYGQAPQAETPVGKNKGWGESLQSSHTQWKQHIVRVIGPQRAPVLGTVVSSDGLIVAKLSELSEPLTCETATGQKFPGRQIASHPQLDLALIKIEAKLEGVAFPQLALSPQVGDILFSAHLEASRLRIGLVSTALRQLPIQQPPIRSVVSMGLSIAPQLESRTVQHQGKYLQRLGVRLRNVAPRRTGEAANLLVDDLICALNGKPISSLESWTAAIRELKAGQQVQFEVIRKDRWFLAFAEALSETQRTAHDLWGGGPFSEQRFSFDSVIIHDSEIHPDDCGGPVFDLQGNFVGINVARTLRVASLCVPAEQIQVWITAVQPLAKLKQSR